MENYEAGTDQNQGVVGTMARNQEHDDTELVGSRMPRLDPNIVTDQSGGTLNGEDAVEDTDNMGERQYINDEGEATDEGDASTEASNRE